MNIMALTVTCRPLGYYRQFQEDLRVPELNKEAFRVNQGTTENS